MTAESTVRADLVKVFLLTVAWLFVIPAATLFFIDYALRTQDAAFLERVEQRVAADTRRSPDEKRELIGFYRAHPLSAACSASGPDEQAFHDQVCETYSMHWQFHGAERAARATLWLGVALLLTALALGALAFVNRGLRYASFVAGWRVITVGSAVEVVLQSAMVVWLSFWVTAYFWERYYIKLVGIAGVAAAAAVFFAIYTLFKKSASANEIEGDLLTPEAAPRLWQRIRTLAAQVETAPPDQVIAGIDTNFFVTEAPCVVQGQAVQGRTLFISIPLLRVLDTQEADAVLAHELAHLGGGDTKSSAMLGPKLQQFDQYTWEMRGGGLTIVAHYVLRLYRMIFSFALSRDSREREYTADRVAAGLTAPRAIVQSLIKISAYASYRNDVEHRLFAQDRQHGASLGIAGYVAEGLQPYARSDAFIATMQTAGVPHPYDSHPPLLERMRNVGHTVGEQDYGAIVTTVPEASWVDDMPTAHEIEQRLWARYEQQFSESHERSLAYRYEPANEEERAVVLRHFPPVAFALKNDARIEVSYQGMHATADGGQPIGWDEVKGLAFSNSSFGNTLVVTHFDKGVLGSRTTKIKLRGLGKDEATFKAVVSQYWHRHQVMRAQQAAREVITP
ncbi:M48 family metallopeptidase [Variovorax sp. LT2P21]|uniref:M48 family metallopeptidase n=1 Tax=Variovorax sp. LT2P21 TaxID=3443731 RepID=UPI003F46E290